MVKICNRFSLVVGLWSDMSIVKYSITWPTGYFYVIYHRSFYFHPGSAIQSLLDPFACSEQSWSEGQAIWAVSRGLRPVAWVPDKIPLRTPLAMPRWPNKRPSHTTITVHISLCPSITLIPELVLVSLSSLLVGWCWFTENKLKQSEISQWDKTWSILTLYPLYTRAALVQNNNLHCRTQHNPTFKHQRQKSEIFNYERN